MDVTYLGNSGIKINGKSATVLVDPPAGAKVKDEVIILTDPEYTARVTGGNIIIDGAGEFEVNGALVVGLPAKLKRSKLEALEGAVYRVEVDGFKIAIVGDIEGKLSDDQAGELGDVDVLIVPVGGNETLSPSEATGIISQLEPKYVIPVNFEKLDDFLKEVGSHPETQPKLKLVSRDLPLETTITPLAVGS